MTSTGISVGDTLTVRQDKTGEFDQLYSTIQSMTASLEFNVIAVGENGSLTVASSRAGTFESEKMNKDHVFQASPDLFEPSTAG